MLLIGCWHPEHPVPRAKEQHMLLYAHAEESHISLGSVQRSRKQARKKKRRLGPSSQMQMICRHHFVKAHTVPINQIICIYPYNSRLSSFFNLFFGFFFSIFQGRASPLSSFWVQVKIPLVDSSSRGPSFMQVPKINILTFSKEKKVTSIP
jgi:hypothetical protein